MRPLPESVAKAWIECYGYQQAVNLCASSLYLYRKQPNEVEYYKMVADEIERINTENSHA